jgi:hypothetical protein
LTDQKKQLYISRMTPERREILQRVADGELSPEEAERMLHDIEGAAAPVRESRVRLVKVSLGVGGIEIVGDPDVAEAEVDGPHRAEVNGDTLVIHGELEPGDEGFTFRLGPRGRRVGGVHVGRHHGREFRAARLRVRMNPSLAVDAELDAGPLTISGIDGPIRARIAAGPISIEDFTGELDVAVNAGAVRANGKLTDGESRIRSDAGAIRVSLDPSSSVHVIAQAALGKVMVPGSENGARKRFTGDRREAVIGDGDATLRVETAMGTVHVSVRSDSV